MQRQTMEHAVVIAGAGPAGMMLAGELALAGVDALVLERRPDATLDGSRAGGLHTRTIELLDQRGIADRFLAVGQTHQAMPFGTTTLDMSDLRTRHPYFLGIWQRETEQLLAAWVAELGVRVAYGTELVDVAQDAAGVDLRLADGRTLRAGYLVGCDGGRSLVRKAAGIAFPGSDATKSNLIAELRAREQPPAGLHHDASGVHAFQPLDAGRFRVVTTEPRVGRGREPTLDELRASLTAAFGSDFGAHDASWISRFTDATRHAASYRAGRILLAGDAAHVHYPAGGQGLSLGLHDAVNLGWKLAQVVHGRSSPALLDSYHAERHPAVARVLRHTMALGALQRRDERSDALVALVSDLASLDEPRHRLIGIASGLDVHYDLGAGHPLLGRRMPDLDLETADGPTRVFRLLHDARPLLLDLGAAGRRSIAPWSDRVRRVDARCEGPWELPVIGEVAAPGAVLVRPDGYVAWVEDGSELALEDALSAWFGAPRGTTIPGT